MLLFWVGLQMLLLFQFLTLYLFQCSFFPKDTGNKMPSFKFLFIRLSSPLRIGGGKRKRDVWLCEEVKMSTKDVNIQIAFGLWGNLSSFIQRILLHRNEPAGIMRCWWRYATGSASSRHSLSSARFASRTSVHMYKEILADVTVRIFWFVLNHLQSDVTRIAHASVWSTSSGCVLSWS